MFYIQKSDGRKLTTVDQADNAREANEKLSRNRQKPESGFHYFISRRPCKNWKNGTLAVKPETSFSTEPLELPFTTTPAQAARRLKSMEATAERVAQIMFHPDHKFFKNINMTKTYTFQVNGVRYCGCRPEVVPSGIMFDLTKATSAVKISV